MATKGFRRFLRKQFLQHADPYPNRRRVFSPKSPQQMEQEYSTELTTQSSKDLATIIDPGHATDITVRHLAKKRTLASFNFSSTKRYVLID